MKLLFSPISINILALKHSMHYSVANFVLTDTCPDKCKKRDCGLKMESSPNHMALNNFGICEGYCSLDVYCWTVWDSSSTDCTGCILGKLIFYKSHYECKIMPDSSE